MSNVTEIFGSEVFNDTVMRSVLEENVYDALMETITEGKPMSLETANAVASAMKDWALQKGATHYTHWFQPMTGVTAEKHDSFISPAEGGKAIMEFSGKELIKGEPDASSFPSGGLRETCEARGYTAWDPSSFAFIKDGTLCVPTAFCSYGGEALDKKTPLLRSMETINNQAVRVLKLLGDDTTSNINITVGPEQEYFLVDKNLYDMREDLVFTGRTLFGAKPPKGQELEDHYFGVIKPRVSAFMKEVDEELWKLGIYAKTKHNEAAPAQHELAPVFTTVNIATDHNQLTMEIMKKIALKHDLVCLLHEKPFAGVNGSGKHNNWSISTNGGENIFNPGKNPHDNKRFILFLCAVIKAVDEYQDLLRVCISTAGNDHRLGGDEAPPAIVSIYLGEQIESVLEALENDAEYSEKKREKMQSGAHVIPTFSKDTADRNRTSPLAFTGNKFEFRMLGSANSVAGPNTVFNTIVAEALCQFADELEKADDVNLAVDELIRKTIKKHKRIIFSGNNYSEEWVKEAKERGLLNISSTPEAIPYLIDKKNIDLFTKHAVYNEAELEARCEILLETYVKTVNIEALTMVDMIKKDIIPAVSGYTEEISNAALAKKAFVKSVNTKMEENLVILLSELNSKLYEASEKIEKAIADSSEFEGNIMGLSRYYRESVLEAMNNARIIIDELEVNTSREYWPYPTYADLLFSVN